MMVGRVLARRVAMLMVVSIQEAQSLSIPRRTSQEEEQGGTQSHQGPNKRSRRLRQAVRGNQRQGSPLLTIPDM